MVTPAGIGSGEFFGAPVVFAVPLPTPADRIVTIAATGRTITVPQSARTCTAEP